jgi:hypothetical protein
MENSEKIKMLHDQAVCILTFLNNLTTSEMEFVLSMACGLFLNAKARARIEQKPDNLVNMAKSLFDKDEEVLDVILKEVMYEFFNKTDLQIASLKSIV